MTEEADFAKLPTLDKVVHKNWKCRQMGYQEAKNIFITSDNCSEYLGVINNFVNDSNIIALEGGLEAALSFVENVAGAKKVADELSSTIILKCLSSTRAKSKEFSVNILFMFMELEKHDTIVENCTKALTNKVPKVVVACLEFLKASLNAFGNKVVSIKIFIKDVIGLLDHRDKNVRDAAKNLIVEMYRWAGKAISAQIASVKSTVLTELNAEFENITPGTEKPTRWLASQKPSEEELAKLQKKKDKDEHAEDEESEVEEETAQQEEIDPYDFAPEVDILKKLPANFHTLLESKNWKERKEALDSFESLTQNVIKCAPGDYNDILRDLNNVIAKDTNIILVAQAAKIAHFLYTALRNNIASHSSTLFATCLAKFKEKKPTVVTNLRNLIDEVFKYISYESCSELIQESLGNKNPSIKLETALFLYRFLASLPKDSPRCDKKTVKSLCTGLLKTSQDTAGDVRDASFDALGCLMYIIGEKKMAPYTGDLDSIKMTKIKESCEKCQSSKSSSNPQVKEKVAEKAKSEKKETKPTTANKPSDKEGEKKTTAAAAKKPVPQKKAVVKKKEKPTPGALPSENQISDEAAEAKCREFFSEELVNQLSAAKWQDKKEALDSIQNKVKASDTNAIPVQAIVKLMLKKPGLKESNFNVLCAKIDVIEVALKTHGTCSQIIAEITAPELIEKIGDTKAGKGCKSCLTTLADVTKFELVGPFLLKGAVDQKNPKNKEECLNWLCDNIKLFGQSLQVKEIITTVKALISHQNAAIRNSTIQLCGVLHLYIGDRIKALLSDEKPQTIQLIEAEIEKNAGAKAPAPTMGYASRLVEEVESEEEAGEDLEDGGTEETPKDKGSKSNMAKIKAVMTLPNEGAIGDDSAVAKCTEFFGNESMTLYNAAKWQERKEALENFLTKIKASEPKEIPVQAISRLILIKPGFKETNFNVLCLKIDLVKEAVAGYGPCPPVIAEIIPPALIDKIGDIKAGKNCLSCLTSIADATKFDLVATHVMAGTKSQKNPKNIQECLSWISDNMLLFGQSLAVKDVVSTISATIGHANPGVRTASLKLGTTLYSYIGEKLKAHLSDNANFLSLLDNELKNSPPSEPPIPSLGMAARIIEAGGKVDKNGALIKETAPPAQVAKKVAKPPKPVSKTSPLAKEDKKPPSPAAEIEEEEEPVIEEEVPKEQPSRKTGALKGRASILTSKKQAELEAAQAAAAVPVLVTNNLRVNRQNDEKKRRALKWDFDIPTKDHIEQLKSQFTAAGASPDFIFQLFHTDFKQHLKAIDNIYKMLDGVWQATCDPFDTAIANLDILMKWMVFRFFETNPVVLCRGLEFFLIIFRKMAENQMQISDYEVNSFVPYLVNKLGDPKENIRNIIKEIFEALMEIYPNNKLTTFLMNGFKLKANKGRQSCLEIIVVLLLKNRLETFQPTIDASIKAIGSMVSDKDSSTRTAALNNLVVIHDIIGEKIWKVLKSLSAKDTSMIEERIKRADIDSIAQNAGVAKNVANDTGRARITIPTKTAGPAVIRPSTAPEQNVPTSEPYPQRVNENRPQTAKVQNENVRRILDEIIDREPDPMPQKPVLYVDEKTHEELMQPLPKIKISEKPLSIQVKSNPHISSVITLLVTKIQSSVILESCTALAQIDELIKDSKSFLLNSFIDEICILINMQLKQTMNRLNDEPKISASEASMQLRSLIAVIDSIIFHENLSTCISKDNVKNLLSSLFTLLVDENITQLKDSELFIRSINGVIESIIQHGDKTKVFSAILKLIYEVVQSGHLTTNYSMSVLKASWKEIRNLKVFLKHIDLKVVLLDCHNFLKAFPSDYWTNKKSDLPLRTIKTFLHHLAKYKGAKLLLVIEMITNKQKDTEIEAYLVKILKRFSVNNEFELVDEEYVDNSLSTEKEAKRIIDRILNEDRTKGIRELYEFKQRNPSFNLTSHLEKFSPNMKTFINIALENISLEKTANSFDINGNELKSNILKENQQQNLLHDPISSPNISTSGISNHNAYNQNNTNMELFSVKNHRQKLNEWRQKLGLPFTDYHQDDPDAEVEEIAPEIKPKAQENEVNKETTTEVKPIRKTLAPEELASIKERIALIKAKR